jgi:cation diffusion facilitator CzcD-associated flavoprotein CzcO
VSSVRRANDHWAVRTAAGVETSARAVVVATGIVSNPYVADVPGRERFRGRVMHSVDYRRPGSFRGQRVLVVGAGNSAGEIAAELAATGAVVTIAVRSGANVVPRELFGIPIQYFAAATSLLPSSLQRSISATIARVSQLARGPAVLPPARTTSCSAIPLIGFHLVDALRAGTIRLKRGGVELTVDGARFADGTAEPFDRVILATGFRAALGALGASVHVDDCGFARRRQRVVSEDQPNLYFVGHNYDTRGGLRNIARDARIAAGMIRGRGR